MAVILVTGGTGTLGKPVCDGLRAKGHEVRVLSRHSPPPYAVDLRDGTGLGAAVEGVDTIVHCASSPRGGDEKAAENLLAAARGARVGHLVYISIVGVDRVPLGYYRAKHRVERMIERAGESGGPGWTVLRATQFHDLVLQVLSAAARLPLVMPVPSVSVQSIDSAEVADRLVELATGPPGGRVPDMGGPEVRPLRELARAYLRASGRRRTPVPLRLAGKTYAQYRAGAHLTPENAVGKVTFEEFLDHRRR
ncbi:SDR family oxidoreductase [Streptomyces sp. NPDC051018]|uniref:SDR family oxidoreductase n=1 Tax=Streptomyces sp. NPDC051018 TaxID=3365639 RepID=UPI0037BC837C